MITWVASAYQYSPCAKQVWYILIVQSARRSPHKFLCHLVPSLYAHTAHTAGRLSIVESRPEASHDGLQTGRPRRVWLGSFAISWFWKSLKRIYIDGLEEWIDMNQHVIPTPSHKIQIVKTISKLETSNDSNGWSVNCAISWKQKNVNKFCLCLLGFVPSNHLPKVKQRYHRSVPVRKQTSVPSFRDVWSDGFKVFVLQFSSLKKWASTKIQCVSLSGVSMLDNCL